MKRAKPQSKDPNTACGTYTASGNSLENSPMQHGGANILGILRLRASHLVSARRYQRAPLRMTGRIEYRGNQAAYITIGDPSLSSRDQKSHKLSG